MLAIYLHVVIGGETSFEFWSPLVGFGQLMGMFSVPTAIALIVALFVYVASMFAFAPAAARSTSGLHEEPRV